MTEGTAEKPSTRLILHVLAFRPSVSCSRLHCRSWGLFRVPFPCARPFVRAQLPYLRNHPPGKKYDPSQEIYGKHIRSEAHFGPATPDRPMTITLPTSHGVYCFPPACDTFIFSSCKLASAANASASSACCQSATSCGRRGKEGRNATADLEICLARLLSLLSTFCDNVPPRQQTEFIRARRVGNHRQRHSQRDR